MATHSSILAWRIPWTEVSYSPQGRKKSQTLLGTQAHTFIIYIGFYGFHSDLTYILESPQQFYRWEEQVLYYSICKVIH